MGRVRAPQKNRRLGSRPARAGHHRARDRPQDVLHGAPSVSLDLLARDDGDGRPDLTDLFGRRGGGHDHVLGDGRNLRGSDGWDEAARDERHDPDRRGGADSPARGVAARDRVESEEHRRPRELRGERVPEERNRRRVAEREPPGSRRIGAGHRPLGEIRRQKEEDRAARGQRGEPSGPGVACEAPTGDDHQGEGPVHGEPHERDRLPSGWQVEDEIGEEHGRDRNGPRPPAWKSRAGEEADRAHRDEVGGMRKQPGKSAEEHEQERGRHSNLPFDETRSPEVKRTSRVSRSREHVPSPFPVGEAFRPAGFLASGSFAVGLLPGRATSIDLTRPVVRCPGRPR